MKNKSGIDIVKLFMALVVVMIHTAGKDYDVLKVAVPYFFIASGFFFFKKWGREDGLKSNYKWLVRISLMYIIWTIIYLPFTIYGACQDGLSIGKSIIVFFRNFVFVGENYLSWPLWYLLASIWAGAIFLLLRKLNIPVFVISIVSVLLFFLAWMLDINQTHLHQVLFKVDDYRILSALCFMSIGGTTGLFIEKIPNKVKIIISLLIAAVSLLFAHWMWPLAAVAIFIFSESLQLPDKYATIAFKLRNISTLVFLLHMVFAGIAFLIFDAEKGWVLFGSISIISLIAAYVIVKLGDNKEFNKIMNCVFQFKYDNKKLHSMVESTPRKN